MRIVGGHRDWSARRGLGVDSMGGSGWNWRRAWRKRRYVASLMIPRGCWGRNRVMGIVGFGTGRVVEGSVAESEDCVAERETLKSPQDK